MAWAIYRYLDIILLIHINRFIKTDVEKNARVGTITTILMLLKMQIYILAYFKVRYEVYPELHVVLSL